MCAAGIHSACPVPSLVVQERQESNGTSLQKKSELLQPVHGLPQKKVEGDACDLSCQQSVQQNLNTHSP